ncbi:MAG: radical SAM protein [Spirochaetes bacterium]|nr:radical SAM protein [Spirochaetota bacterium]
MNKKYCILDCYVDEPACFGVPPFVSPYPRYVYGALIDAGIYDDAICYLTIDQLRTSNYSFSQNYDYVFLIGGAIVPGKYLGFKIGTIREITKIIAINKKQRFAIGGMIAHLVKDFPNTTLVTGDIEQFAYSVACGKDPFTDNYRTYTDLARWAVAGSKCVTFHPLFPNLICEIETYRGCPRKNHCSFCAEGLLQSVAFRDEEDILCEIDALIHNGITRFRIGRQADIIAYKSHLQEFLHGFPRPNPDAVINLFGELKKRTNDGRITMLNIDNANPGTIFYFPAESQAIIECIADTVTCGDTIPLGVESFDPEVIVKNNLKLHKDQVIDVVRLINEAGGKTQSGMYRLLPGINLIHGLIGENANTFKINYESLCQIMEKGLLLKRINIRSLFPFPGTIAAQKHVHNTLIENRYRYYRDKIRSEIDHVMIQKLFPVGTIIKNMQVLLQLHGYSYAKEIRSYAITAKIPLVLPQNSFTDCIVIGHQERSLLCVPYPIAINTLPQKALEAIPGIGKKGASAIIMNRPFKEMNDVKPFLVFVPETIVQAIALGL